MIRSSAAAVVAITLSLFPACGPQQDPSGPGRSPAGDEAPAAPGRDDWFVDKASDAGLTFTYFKSDGTIATTEGEIDKVSVSLVITVDPGTKTAATQRLTTEIDLRNRDCDVDAEVC